MKQKLYALDAFFIEKLKLSENDPDMFGPALRFIPHELKKDTHSLIGESFGYYSGFSF